ncbi:outer membrane protein assembly factor BamB [Ramlibacter sp. PS4R-6]|uniref:outer membrane protein assembly factor BamB n=1 Tax=Ramlibacter sp. PS4R-6 TaxID=3133438 RepID=UPI0030A58C4F
MKSARILVAALALALAGCSVLPSWMGGGPDKPKAAELTSNPASLGVRQAWTARIGPVDIPVAVNVQGTTVTLASSDGSIAALDAASGRELWRTSAGGPIAAGVGSDGRVSAVVTTGGDVVAFRDGKELWRQRLNVSGYTAPFVAGGRVFVLLADRSVVAFDGQNGRRLWTQTRPSQPLSLKYPGTMLAVGDTLVVGLAGRLVGMNPNTGAPRWDVAVATPRGINDVERLADLVGRASRVADIVCARAFQTAVGCVDAGRGAVVWTKSANGFEGVDGDGSFVFGTEADSTVIAWKRDSGDKAWTSDLLLNRGLSAPLVLGRAVVVGDDFGYVHLLAREDGKLLNRLATDGTPIMGAPVAAGTTLVVVTKGGGVFGFVPQ